jgi:hypothetical protein
VSIQDLGSLGELIAAAATIATLFYLAAQIRQHSKTTMAATYEALLAQWREHIRVTFVTNPENLDIWRKGLVDFDSLSGHEQARFSFILSEEQLFIENLIQQAERRNITEAQLAPWLDYFSGELRAPGGAVWWKSFSAVLNPQFAERMEAHLAKTRGQPTFVESMSPLFNFSDDPRDDA